MKTEKLITHKGTIVNANKKITQKEDGLYDVVMEDVGFYCHVSYVDGKVTGVDITVGKMGEQLRVYEVLGRCISVGLRNGVDISEYIDELEHVCFEPSGITKNQHIPHVKSIVDYIAKYLRGLSVGS